MRLALSIAVLVPTAAVAESPASDVRSALSQCASETDPAARLACYDRIAGGTNAAHGEAPAAAGEAEGESHARDEQPEQPPADEDQPSRDAATARPEPDAANRSEPGKLATAPAPSVAPAAKPAPAPAPEARFGLPAKRDSERLREIETQVVGEFSGWDAETTFELENGQVWRQIDQKCLPQPAMNPTVTIRRGFLGNYILKVEGLNKVCRVERVR